jgi:putative ABC transport system permease protein
LNTRLAETLGLRAGDAAEVEVLEGARPTRTLRVAGVVDELLGVDAYMDRRALNRFLREGGTVSGAHLAVDTERAPVLYGTLKRTPAVAAVLIREGALRSFQEAVANTFAVFTTVLVGLASAIALGMVYNAARISLSERGRELASLRVLGFTRGEAARLLLGEQAVVSAAGIPVGLALGWIACAAISRAYDSDLFRLPLTLTARTYAFASLVVAAAAFLSGLLVRRRVDRLDLVAVLKTRE